jgi:hypothetical protein
VRLVLLAFLDRRSRSPYGIGWRITATRRPRLRSRPDRKRAVCDFPQPVRTAETAMTGTRAGSQVRSGPSRTKSAPAESAREARCMTRACGMSLYANATRSTRCFWQIASSSASATIGMPSGYRGPASAAGYERPAMPGIWAAVKATTSYAGSSR